MVAKKTGNKQQAKGINPMVSHINANQVYLEMKRRGIPGLAYYDKVVKALDELKVPTITMPMGSKTQTLYEYGPVRDWMARIIAEHEAKQSIGKARSVASSDHGGMDQVLEQIRMCKEQIASMAGAMVRLNQKIDKLAEVNEHFGKAGEKLTLEMERRFDELGHDIDNGFSLLIDALTEPLKRPADGTEVEEAAGMPVSAAKKGDDDLDAALSSTDD